MFCFSACIGSGFFYTLTASCMAASCLAVDSPTLLSLLKNGVNVFGFSTYISYVAISMLILLSEPIPSPLPNLLPVFRMLRQYIFYAYLSFSILLLSSCRRSSLSTAELLSFEVADGLLNRLSEYRVILCFWEDVRIPI
jgi:hypothetical protein